MSCLCLSWGIFWGSQIEPKSQFFEPRSFEVVLSSLRSLASQNEKIARILDIGQSYGQRKIIILEIAAKGNNSVPRPEERPAILVSANLEGLNFLGTEAACRLGKKLIEGYGKDKAITDILNRRTIYIAPLLNPDGYAHWFGRFR